MLAPPAALRSTGNWVSSFIGIAMFGLKRPMHCGWKQFLANLGQQPIKLTPGRALSSIPPPCWEQEDCKPYVLLRFQASRDTGIGLTLPDATAEPGFRRFSQA